MPAACSEQYWDSIGSFGGWVGVGGCFFIARFGGFCLLTGMGGDAQLPPALRKPWAECWAVHCVLSETFFCFGLSQGTSEW